jgi:putative heme-binding domain-containing protein
MRNVRIAATMACLIGAVVFLCSEPEPTRADAKAATKRVPWTASKVQGSPEPPLPYRVVPAFEKLSFKNPVHMTNAPGTDRLFVLLQAGEIRSFPNRQDVAGTDLVIDVSKDLTSWKAGQGEIDGFDAVFGMTFHPKFAENRFCYVCYVLKGKNGKPLPDGTRVSRFTVTKTDPPKIEPASERILLTFLSGGHNGGCLCFGNDGYLYISSGDAADPNPPDRLNTGQDCSDFLSSILRIDVDQVGEKTPYRIPNDNPFIGIKDVRPEIWAFGFRNPWKMSFDRATGELWAGDVGWEMWEMIHRVKKGTNAGWPIKEGPQPIRPDDKVGPAPIIPAAISLPHTEAASITGGFVYRGKKLPGLVGKYVYGDWMSRKLWAASFNADSILKNEEIAQGSQKIITFAEDNAGELYFLDYQDNGRIFQLAVNEEANKPQPAFPTKLSQTGLFADVKTHTLAPGVQPYSINAEPWVDHATTERFLALPGTSAVTYYREAKPVPETAWFNAHVFLPAGAVIAKTFSLETERGNPKSRRRIETQFFHFDGKELRGYTYRWNDDQTDASLVPSGGDNADYTIKDPQAPGGVRKQTWHFAARGECRQCHNPWAGEVLGFREEQLTSPNDNRFQTLIDLGMVLRGKEATKPEPTPLVNPHGTGDLNAKARSYLHVNCAHCHQFGAGGSVNLQLKYGITIEEMLTLETRPVQGSFDIPNCQIIAPGDPYRSVLYYRMAKQGRGRMPHIGSEFVDEEGVKLIRDWIRQLPVRKDDRALVEKCCRTNTSENERRNAIDKLLSNVSGALMLLDAWDGQRLIPAAKTMILARSADRDPAVRDLFERFIPDEQRVKRLGTLIKPESLLAMTGDSKRGRDVFFKTQGLQCANCHKVGDTGGAIGPELTLIGKKLSRRQLLENILDPSKEIEPKYATYLLDTDDGRSLSGLLMSKTEKEIVVRDNQGKDHTFPPARVTLTPSKKSLMPDQLLRDLTAQQAADLLAYLESLK